MNAHVFTVAMLCVAGMVLAAPEPEYTVEQLTDIYLRGSGKEDIVLFDKEEDIPLSEDVSFFCSNRANPEWKRTVIGGDISHMDMTLPTSFLVHGWTDSTNSSWMRDTVEDHKTFWDYNICAVNWHRLANYKYYMSVKYTRDVGDYIGQFIEFLVTYGATLDQMTVIGHSLGGQVAGFAGARLEGQLGNIIGLDPAGPLYTNPKDVGPSGRLDPTDAVRVQVIHTAGGTLGVYEECGHVDFYPNGGVSPQAGCVLTGTIKPQSPIHCSHLRAYHFFRFSLNADNGFYARPCSNHAKWTANLCRNNEPIDRFGYFSTAMGIYYLDTERREPYAKNSVY